jgi:hypothetical protein
MRDSKDALRHRVQYLEDTLAEKDAELVRLREDKAASRSDDKKRKGKKRPRPDAKREAAPKPVEPWEIRRGKLQPDGSVRYVVRPIEAIWVGIMAAVSILIVAVAGSDMVSDGKAFPWLMIPIFGVMPLAPTFRAGFDVSSEQKTVYVWQSWGPITYSSFTLARLKLPDVRTGVETDIDNDGRTSRSRVTRLYWGSQNIVATLKASELRELMDEARAQVAHAEQG